MNRNRFAFSVCNSLVALAALAAFGAVDVASAKSVSLSASVAQVKSGCAKAGGNFAYHDGGYGCVKANCNGQGGSCSVTCNNAGQCIGQTPARVATGGSLGQILSGGLGKAEMTEGKSATPAKTGVLEPGIFGGGAAGAGGNGPSTTGAPAGGGRAPSAPPAAGPIIR